jgi:superfamily II DNA or RNA helicase
MIAHVLSTSFFRQRDELEKAHHIVDTPTDGDFTKVEDGSSCWITITDESSPLHGRHVLITRRPDGLFAIDSHGTAAREIRQHTKGKLWDAENNQMVDAKTKKKVSAPEKEDAGDEEDDGNRTGRLVQSRYIGKPLRERGGKTVQGDLAEEENKKIEAVKKIRKPISEEQKRRKELRTGHTKTVMEILGVSHRIFNDEEAKELRGGVRKWYMNDLRNQCKVQGMNSSATEAHLEKHKKDINGVVRSVVNQLRAHQGGMNDDVKRELYHGISKYNQRLKAEDAAAAGDKEARKRKKLGLSPEDVSNASDENSSEQVSLGKIDVKDLGKLSKQQLQKKAMEQIDRSAKKVDKVNPQDARTVKEDGTISLDGMSPKQLLTHVLSDPDKARAASEHLSSAATESAEIKRLEQEKRKHKIPGRSVISAGTVSEQSTMPHHVNYKEKPYGELIKKELDSLLERRVMGKHDISFWNDVVSSLVGKGERKVTNPLGEDATLDQLLPHVATGAHATMVSLFNNRILSAPFTSDDLHGLIKIFNSDGAGTALAIKLFNELKAGEDSEEGHAGLEKFQGMTQRLGKYLDSEQIVAEDTAFNRYRDLQAMMKHAQDRYRDDLPDDAKRENLMEQQRLFQRMQQSAGEAWGSTEAAANLMHSMAALSRPGAKKTNALSFVMTDKRQASAAAGRLGLSQAKGVTVEPISERGRQLYRVTVPLSSLTGSKHLRVKEITQADQHQSQRDWDMMHADADGYATDENTGERRKVEGIPSIKDYKLPGFRDKIGDKPFQAYPSQRNTIEFALHSGGRAIVNLPVGGGKTNIGLGFFAKRIDAARQSGKAYLGVVAVPDGGISHWQKDAQKFLNEPGDKRGDGYHVLTMPEVTGSRDAGGTRAKIWAQAKAMKEAGKSVVVVISHKGMSSDARRDKSGQHLKNSMDRAFMEQVGIDGLVGDEMHRVMTYRPKKDTYELSLAGQKIQRMNLGDRLALSATPAQEKIGELHALAGLVHGERVQVGDSGKRHRMEGNPLGEKKKEFEERTAGLTTAQSGHEKAKQEYMHTITSPILHGGDIKTDFGGVIKEVVHNVTHTKAQREQYFDLAKNKEKYMGQLRQQRTEPVILDKVKSLMAKLKNPTPGTQKLADRVNAIMADKSKGSTKEKRMLAVAEMMHQRHLKAKAEGRNAHVGYDYTTLSKKDRREVDSHLEGDFQRMKEANLATQGAETENGKTKSQNARINSVVANISKSNDKDRHIIFAESPEQVAAIKAALKHSGLGEDQVGDMTHGKSFGKETQAGINDRIERDKGFYNDPKSKMKVVILDEKSSELHNLPLAKHVHFAGVPRNAGILEQVIGRGTRGELRKEAGTGDVIVHRYVHQDDPADYERWEKLRQALQVMHGISPGLRPKTEKSLTKIVHVVPFSRFFGQRRGAETALNTLALVDFCEMRKSILYSMKPNHRYFTREWDATNHKWKYVYDMVKEKNFHIGIGVHPRDKKKLIVLFDANSETVQDLAPAKDMEKRVLQAIPGAEKVSLYDPLLSMKDVNKGSWELAIPIHEIDRLHDFFSPSQVGVTEQAQNLLAKDHDNGGDRLRYSYQANGEPNHYISVTPHGGLRSKSHGADTLFYGPEIAQYRDILESAGATYDSRHRGMLMKGDAIRATQKVQAQIKRDKSGKLDQSGGDAVPGSRRKHGAVQGGLPQGGDIGGKAAAEEPGIGTGSRVLSQVGDPVLDLAQIKSPEPTAALKPETEAFLRHPALSKRDQDEQVRDTRIALSAFGRGQRGFIDFSQPGSGKTYISAAVLKEMAPKKVLWLLPWASYSGMQDQTEDVLTHVGYKGTFWGKGDVPEVDDHMVIFSTYGHLLKLKNEGKLDGVKFDMVFCDEAHNAAKVDGADSSQYAAVTKEITDSADHTYWMSATPFNDTSDMHYLENLGMWANQGFANFAKLHGCRMSVRKVYEDIVRNGDVVGKQQVGEHHSFVFEGSTKDLLAVNKKLISGGYGCSRTVHIDKKLNNSFMKLGMKQEHLDLYGEVMHAFDMMKTISGRTGSLEWQRTAAVRRILESAKIDHAVKLAEKELAAGRQVMITTSFVSERVHNMADLLYSLNKGNASTTKQLDSIMHIRLASIGDQTLHEYLSNIKVNLPSPVDELIRRLGGTDKVAQIHGNIKPAMQIAEKKAFNSGQKKILVGVVDAVGTGHSFHDTRGDAPRTQINLTIPWSATQTNQVWNRCYRLGVKSDTNQYWLFSDIPSEKRIAAIVGTRLRNMGAIVGGMESHADADLMNQFHFNRLAADSEGDEKSVMGAGVDLEKRNQWAKEREEIQKELVQRGLLDPEKVEVKAATKQKGKGYNPWAHMRR